MTTGTARVRAASVKVGDSTLGVLPRDLAEKLETERIATRAALYVALTASLDAVLATTDARLRRGATGIVAIAEPSS